MPDIKIRIEGDEKLKRALSDPRLIRGPLKTFLTRSAFIVELNAKQKAPVDTGRLRSSIMTLLRPPRAAIGPPVEYAPHVEWGSRPHWPPRGALQPWARRHGFPAGSVGDFLVRRAIARRGTRAHPFMRPAARASLSGIRAAYQAMMVEIKARWSSHAV